ncbi:MAG: DNA mismatch repair protein MutS [Candidatus Woesearchaeota archaeon]|nr:MAG: DNA mismatch repair protein MutS [Candidatus Woesearchaeota archaeon]
MIPDREKTTPMMRQFLELKTQHSDCILLFRAGDFYETFYDDAKECSKLLGITLTQRGGTPMAGVPYHSITPYIRKLLGENKKVALCEQLEDPKLAKGLVKRGITRIITPGTILEDEYLSSFENNYLMAIYSPKDISEYFGVALIDITTGEFLTSQIQDQDDIKTLIRRYMPNEIIHNESSFSKSLNTFIKNANIYSTSLSDMRFNRLYADEILKKQFNLKASQLGLDGKDYAVIACGALLFYIYKLQKLDLSHINKIKYIALSQNMILDSISLRNLEIVENLYAKDGKKTLFGILNNTKTNAGARLLKKHLTAPLLDKKALEERLEGVEEMNTLIFERDEIREHLGKIQDIERIASRISSEIVSPKDLFALKITLQNIPALRQTLQNCETKLLKSIKKIDTLPEITDLLDKAIVENAPSHTRDIGYLKSEYNSELQALHELAFHSKTFIRNMEEEEKKLTGISSLKIKYNKIFGYFIEISQAQANKVPSRYIPKQTLANAQRFVTEELSQKESQILGAEEKIRALEEELYKAIVFKLKSYIKSFQDIAEKLALLDLLTTHSLNAQLYHYVRPTFHDDETVIIEGRNPLVERFTTHYIPNNTSLSKEETLQIITGPNTSGKSTFLRQNALIVIMAQAGMFVPAKSAQLRIYDRVFTRIGAHDELVEGHSTFMVEMSETANILNNASDKSLVLLDEIGRGTSTYDGLAIAWAITEELAQKQTHTMFATHYHQLNKLSSFFANIRNYHVLVREEGEKVEFIRQIVKGGTDKSYGIYVGKLAGIPEHVLERAKEVQQNIEEKEDIVIRQEFKESLQKRAKKNEAPKEEKGLGEFM